MDREEDNVRRHERNIVLLYAPAAARKALAALLTLDDALGQILRTTREPMVGQMRMAWWREALTRLDMAPPPAQPVLTMLAAHVLPRGVTGAALGEMVDGWEALLAEPLDTTALAGFAEARGAGLFRAGGTILDAHDPALASAGHGWALVDLAGHVVDPAIASHAREQAAAGFAAAFHHRWLRSARPLGALALLALADLAGVPPGSPRRIARLLIHRLTGR